MNNIILIALISFTKFLSLLPKSIFTSKNSPLWQLIGKFDEEKEKNHLERILIIVFLKKIKDGEKI